MNSLYDRLNDKQKEAVFHTEGPLLILAGAGSGKTRVLTHRIAYLIGEKNVAPWNILAITFTNKAAEEMRTRVDALVSDDARSVWVATFHSTCVRILRQNIHLLGYERDFSIYDTDDQKTLMKQVLKRLEMDPRVYRERAVLSAISNAKSQMLGPDAFSAQAAGEYYQERVAEAYIEYQQECKKNNAVDFDDLLMLTVQLFREFPDVLSRYQARFRYVLVDEYQDTNAVQFEFLRLLCTRSGNLCVVGDDDQSIYKFRGADIQNILSFEDTFPDAKVIKLEQNYRSTPNILNAANAVIAHNSGRKDKSLWTERAPGAPVRFIQYESAYDEAEGILRDIERSMPAIDLASCAVLYRTNAQSRVLEEKCVSFNIPYRLIGGVNFYQRKEIKDMICYLKVIANGLDDLALQRVINVPRRGIGQATLNKIAAYAAENGQSMFEALSQDDLQKKLGRAGEKIRAFSRMILDYRERAADLPAAELFDELLEGSGYREELLKEDPVEAQARLENLQEFRSKAADYDQSHEPGQLGLFLEEVALVAEVDALDESENRLLLMTLHGAKGLEFPRVYLAGMEEGLFPGSAAIFDESEDELEEERRLRYVGMTRAQNELILTAAKRRMVNGETVWHNPSRFIEEIPENLLKREGTGMPAPAPAASTGQRTLAWSFKQRNSSADEKKMFMGKTFSVERMDRLDYETGDRVIHQKYGEGTVRSIVKGKKDYEVEVEFSDGQVKRFFASFAKLLKVDES